MKRYYWTVPNEASGGIFALLLEASLFGRCTPSYTDCINPIHIHVGNRYAFEIKRFHCSKLKMANCLLQKETVCLC